MSNSKYLFSMPVKVYCGENSVQNIVNEVSGSSVLLLTDSFLYQNGTAQKIGSLLHDKQVTYFYDVEPNPSTLSVDKCTALARDKKVTTVVGVGGGSSLDVAKAVSCLISNPGSIYDYYAGGTKTFETRTVKLILMPTTAGTGSEVTNVGVFTDPHSGSKKPFVSSEFWADVAIADAVMTHTLPKIQTASTGMDAFCHAIEAYWNRESQPMCDYLAMGAMKKILENIKLAYDEPQNAKARSEMMTAALMAGVAFSQTRTTGVHAVSFPLTTDFHANHGTACAITLAAFTRASTEMAEEKMQTLAAFLGFKNVEALAEGIEELMKSMDMPIRLSQIGVKESNLMHIVEVGMSAAAQMQLTPATMNIDTVYALLHSIL